MQVPAALMAGLVDRDILAAWRSKPALPYSGGAKNTVKSRGFRMASVLRGNYTPKKEVKAPTQDAGQSLEERFEREALKKVGGSVAFVAKKKVTWSVPEKK